MHMQCIEDCTEAYLFSDEIKQDIDKLMNNFKQKTSGDLSPLVLVYQDFLFTMREVKNLVR